MFVTRLTATTLAALLLLQGSGLPAQDSSSAQSTSKKQRFDGQYDPEEEEFDSHDQSQKIVAPRRATRRAKKSTAARTISLHKTFVASSDLRPMARQLIEYRTPAAYAGVEGLRYETRGTEPGALAWFASRVCALPGRQYPAAITELQKAQPYIGELKDYTSYFIGNSYVSQQ